MAAGEDKEHIDSEEEDEDYVPGIDHEEAASDDNDDAAGGATEDDGPIILSITKQKAVDDAFYDLFGYHYTATANNTKSNDKIPTKSKHTITKQKRILSSIFGNRSCIKLMNNAKSIASLARAKPSSGGMLRLEKRTITEVKRFAGQEIKIEKVVMVPVMLGDDDGKNKIALSIDTTNNTSGTATTSSASTTVGRKAKGVDNLLHEMSKPEKLSTVAKTSADWDLFKSKNADASLKEQLESQATGNDAYLVKKDFLNRVDERRFEAEKAERERNRAKRGK